jgi:hypothetical protein
MCQVHDLALTCISEILLLYLFGPRAHISDVPVTHMDTTVILGAFDVRGFAVETPVSDLVAEAAMPPCRTVLVGMFGAIGPTLTAVEPREFHDSAASRRCFPLLFGHCVHCRLIEGQSLQRGPRSWHAASCPSLICSTKSWGTYAVPKLLTQLLLSMSKTTWSRGWRVDGPGQFAGFVGPSVCTMVRGPRCA